MRWRVVFRTDGWVCICNSRIMLKANKPANNNGRRTQVLVGDSHVKLEALFVRHEQVQLDRPFKLLLRLGTNHRETITLVLRLELPLTLEIRNVMVQRHVPHLPGLSNHAEKRIVGSGSFFLLNPTTFAPRGVSWIASNHRNRVWFAAGNVTRFEYYFPTQPTKFVDGFLIRLRQPVSGRNSC